MVATTSGRSAAAARMSMPGLSSGEPAMVRRIWTAASIPMNAPRARTISVTQCNPTLEGRSVAQIRSSGSVRNPLASHSTALTAPTETPARMAGRMPARSSTRRTPTS